MTERELKKLSRADLLEMMLALSKENEELREQLDQARQQLADRTLTVDKAGSLAEAALQLNGVFEAAQAACEQYTYNIEKLSQRQEQLCAQMEQETKAKCDALEQETKAKCDALEQETKAKCDALEQETKAKCDCMLEEAQKQAEAARSAAEEKSRKIDDDSYAWLSDLLDGKSPKNEQDEAK